MINLFKKGMQLFSKKPAQCKQLDVNAENEYQAMCCGAFNPRFLAKVKKSKADNSKNKNKEKQQRKATKNNNRIVLTSII